MANIKSSKKDIRRIAKRTEANRHVKSRLKTLAKKVHLFASQNEAGKAKEAAVEYSWALDKAAKRNIIHTNRANRQKQAVAKHVFAAAE